ncbi:MAG: DUF6689 family protein [Acidobacteriota bacterium]
MTRLHSSLLGLALFVLPLPVAAQGIVNVVVDGNELRAGISLPGGIGADLEIGFEQVSGLTPQSVGLSATLANLLDPNLLSRLGVGSLVGAFPVLLRIEPPADGGLSFRGVASISLHTHNLDYIPGTPLRIFAAPLGGRFEDITESVGKGSYRCRGRKGSFSEFLILADLRPVRLAVAEKLDRLDRVLNDNAGSIDPAVLDDLTALASQIRSAWAAGQKQQAIAKTDAFLALVQANSGTAIPDVWRSTHDTVNAAGLLRAAGETLKFSLGLKSNLLGLF